MPSAHHPHIDICALDAVRARFAAGDAMAILTPALDEVIWANGPGAALFGFSDIGAIIGAAPQIGLAARRQIMATSGYPKIGKYRAITVRLASGMTSRAVSFVASEIALPGGEDAILLTAPAPTASWRSPVDTAGRAIVGLDQAGQHAAIVDADGRLVAASSGFDALGIKAETLGDLVADARAERLLKRMIEAGPAPMPAGFLRLTDNPATHLLVVIDEVLPDADQAVAATDGAPAGADATGAVAATAPAMPEHETAEPVSAPR